MAKGKRAVALFEVIRQDKRFQSKTSADAPKAKVDFSAKMAEEAADLWKKKNSDPETWSYPKEQIGKSFAAARERLKSDWKSGRERFLLAARSIGAFVARVHGVATGAAAAGIIIGAVMLGRHYLSPRNSSSNIEGALEAGPAHPSVLAVGPANPPAAPSAGPAEISP
jgi:hypothetical protein